MKHFKFERRGKVRIHKKPNAAEVAACKQWWEAELAEVQPEVLGLLGAVAGQAVFGAQFRVTKQRGQWLDGPDGVPTLATIHPSAVLRAPAERRDQEYAGLVHDLKLIAARVAERLTPSYGKRLADEAALLELRLHVVAVHQRDEVDGDRLRARGFALAVVRARAEVGLHRLDHARPCGPTARPDPAAAG